jgi:hypothetical protein
MLVVHPMTADKANNRRGLGKQDIPRRSETCWCADGLVKRITMRLFRFHNVNTF